MPTLLHLEIFEKRFLNSRSRVFKLQNYKFQKIGNLRLNN